MTRYLSFLVLAASLFLIPAAVGREQQDFRERVRDAAQRTDKDLGQYVHRDKLDAPQRDRLDAALKDLNELREAAAAGRLDGERERLERAIENIDAVAKDGSISEPDRQTLGIDLYTLRTILDSWKQ